jgi:two-component system, chemotaxis family, sensor kinase CheA
MSDLFGNESMMDLFIYETTQMLEQLEQCMIKNEKSEQLSKAYINEVFRIMHTIKGSAAMMLLDNLSTLAHSIEDLYECLRSNDIQDIDGSQITDLVLESADFMKGEIIKLTNGEKADGEASGLTEAIKGFLKYLKDRNHSICSNPQEEKKGKAVQQYYIASEERPEAEGVNTYKAIIFFEEGCEMENIRAFTITHNLKGMVKRMYYYPEDIIENDDSIEEIKREGFRIIFKTDRSLDEVNKFFEQTIFLRSLELEAIDEGEFVQEQKSKATEDSLTKGLLEDKKQLQREHKAEVRMETSHQSIISVNVNKLDKLMDLVGEMVIAEAMVTQNQDLEGLKLDSFQKAARQLRKITSELQDMVMSIRMVPLSNTFHKMHRITRDMCKKLDKEVRLEVIGEDTEVDKNIIEHISDPLMHLIRNAIDHGIESAEQRAYAGKNAFGTVTLEAKNAGSDVLVIIKDDGKGLNKEKIINRAKENGLLTKPEEELSEREIYSLIFLPGFSTKENITEFSGRGVGMDVVVKNLELVGGSVLIDSIEGAGTTITLKIPLTLAIIDGMNVKVGNSRYTIPITTIKESFRPKASDIIKDPDGNEMIMVRGQCYPILRIHEYYGVKTEIMAFTEGILIMVEQDEKRICVFVDELLGQQQVVVKALPSYIKNIRKIKGLAGCTLLGDGSISLIIDVSGLFSSRM